MAPRALWKGVLRAGGERVPVKLYSAVDSQAPLRFRLLHEPDLAPLNRRLVDPDSDEVVAYDETRRAWEAEDGRLVVLDEGELESLEPEASRDIEVRRFLPAGSIPAAWYDRPYYLGPDGDAGPWAALARALSETEREGVVRWAMRKKAYVGALRLERGVPMLVTLRYAGEVVPAGALAPPGGRALDDREIAMAEQLVGMLAGPFEPEAFPEAWRARVLELIAAKAEGKTVRLAEYRPRAPEAGSLTESLEASLKALEERRSA